MVATSIGPKAPDNTVKCVGVGISAFTSGPVNLAVVLVAEPKIEGHTSGSGVKTPTTVGLATAHGMAVSATHGSASRAIISPQHWVIAGCFHTHPTKTLTQPAGVNRACSLQNVKKEIETLRKLPRTTASYSYNGT